VFSDGIRRVGRDACHHHAQLVRCREINLVDASTAQDNQPYLLLCQAPHDSGI
jgi:hypothetical protein